MAKAHTNHGWKHRYKAPSGVPARGEGWGGDKAGTGSRKPLSADNQPSADAKMAGKIEAATARDIAKAHAVEMAELLATIARTELAAFLSGGPWAIDRVGEDRYGRTLASISIGDEDAGEHLIAAGLAVSWTGRRHDWCRNAN